MKAADEQFAMAANAIGAGRRVDQLTRTVRADVVEGLELIRRGADDDDRIATDLVGEKITDVRNLLDTAGVLPDLAPETIAFGARIFGRQVSLDRKCQRLCQFVAADVRLFDGIQLTQI